MISLLSLPVEIRLMIYHILFIPAATLRLKSQAAREFPGSSGNLGDLGLILTDSTPAALLQTCRQLHAEAAPVFYKSDIFDFAVSSGALEPDQDRAAMARVDLMRHVSVWAPADWYEERSQRGADWPDWAVGKMVGGALEKCHSARCLTVYYVHFPGFHCCEKLLEDVGALVRRRERLEEIRVVAVGELVQVLGLAKAVANRVRKRGGNRKLLVCRMSPMQLSVSRLVDTVALGRGNPKPFTDVAGVYVGIWKRHWGDERIGEGEK